MCPGTRYLPPKWVSIGRNACGRSHLLSPSCSPHPNRLAAPLPGTSVFIKQIQTPLQKLAACVVLNTGSVNSTGRSFNRTSVWGDPSFPSRLFWTPGIFGERNLYLNVKQEVTHLLVGLYED